MSRKRTVYKTALKTKLVLEVLKGEKTLNEIASANNIADSTLKCNFHSNLFPKK